MGIERASRDGWHLTCCSIVTVDGIELVLQIHEISLYVTKLQACCECETVTLLVFHYFQWELWLSSFSIAKKQLAVGDQIDGRRKTIQNWIVLHTFYVELVPFDRTTFSGPDTVRTPTRLHRNQAVCPYELNYLANWKFINFFLHNTSNEP